MEKHLKIIILAAGKGTRMKSDLAKVLHKVCDKPMINHVLDMVSEVFPNETYVVIGHQAGQVKNTTKSYKNIIYVEQKEQLGTGHAVMMVEYNLTNTHGATIILCGDVPLLKKETVVKLYETYNANKFDGVILTVKLSDPKHYGRIVRNSQGLVEKIVEFRDASEEEKAINEINTGIYCFDTKELFSALKNIRNQNNQKEYYLTDVIEIMVSKGKRIGTFTVSDPLEVHGINDVHDLKTAEDALMHSGSKTG